MRSGKRGMTVKLSQPSVVLDLYRIKNASRLKAEAFPKSDSGFVPGKNLDIQSVGIR
jgi:hypothetical protein